MSQKPFVMSLRVRFGETDLMGIAHHGAYVTYFEAGRVEWLRDRGVRYSEWAARGMHLPVVEMNIRYRRSSRFDDVLTLEVLLAEVKSHSLRFDYRILGDGELRIVGSTRLACIDNLGKLQPFPEEFRRQIEGIPVEE